MVAHSRVVKLFGPLSANLQFRRYFLGEALSNVGDWFTYVAMATLAATSSSQAENLSVVFLSQTLPRVLSSPLGGWIADRFNRRTVSLVVMILRALIVFAMAYVAKRHGVGLALQSLHILRMALGAVSDASTRAALPTWIGRENIGDANRILGGAWSLWLGLGVTLGAWCTAFFGVSISFIVDALSFVASALAFASLPNVETVTAPKVENESASAAPEVSRSELWQSFRENHELALFSCARMSVAFASSAGFLALGVSAAKGHSSSTAAGFLGGYFLVRAIGNGAGAAWKGLGSSYKQLVRTGVVAGVIGVGGVLMIAQWSEYLLAIAIGAFAWGWGMGAHWTLACTQIQQRSPDHVVGRWLSMDLFVFTTAQASATLLATVMGRWVGALRVGVPCGLAAISLVIWWVMARQIAPTTGEIRPST